MKWTTETGWDARLLVDGPGDECLEATASDLIAALRANPEARDAVHAYLMPDCRAAQADAVATWQRYEDRALAAEKARDEAVAEVKRVRDLIDRDRTGLAAGLDGVRQILRGWAWLAEPDNWGSYSYEDHNASTLRKEVAALLREAHAVIANAMADSGRRADSAFYPEHPDRSATIDALRADRDAALSRLAEVERERDYCAEKMREVLAYSSDRERFVAMGAHGWSRCERILEETLSRLDARDDSWEPAGFQRPTIVCLCGSTRFYAEFQRANYEETMAGRIVLSVGFYSHSAEHAHGEGVGCTPAQKVALDALHLRKIEMADEVLILNVGGYIGESTRNELNHATALGKRVRYLEPIDARGSAESKTPGGSALEDPANRFPWEGENGNPWSAPPEPCRACGTVLRPENRRIADGCPCNSPRGVNHGLVPKNTCTCQICDPAQTGAARYKDKAPGGSDSSKGHETQREQCRKTDSVESPQRPLTAEVPSGANVNEGSAPNPLPQPVQSEPAGGSLTRCVFCEGSGIQAGPGEYTTEPCNACRGTGLKQPAPLALTPEQRRTAQRSEVMADVESARRDRYWGYVLKTGDPAHTLDNHLFRDFVDALDWMNQPCVRGSGYSVVCATFRRHSCCGAPYGFRFGASVIERPRLPCGMPGCSNMRGVGHSFCPDCTRRWVEASTPAQSEKEGGG